MWQEHGFWYRFVIIDLVEVSLKTRELFKERLTITGRV